MIFREKSINIVLLVTLVFSSVLMAAPARAADADAAAAQASAAAAAAAAKASAISDAKNADITGHLSAGLGGLFITGGSGVSSAINDNGTVKITGLQDHVFAPWVVGEALFFPKGGNWGGLFVAAQLGSGTGSGGNSDNSIINGLGLGLAVHDFKSGFSVNFGFGWASKSRLASGYVNGQPMPTGTSQPVLESVSAHGPLLVFSYNVTGN